MRFPNQFCFGICVCYDQSSMPCIPVLGFGEDDCMRPEAGEIKSGVLEIVRSSRNESSGSKCAPNQRVFVRVYRTSSEHFAVLYPVRALVTACKPLASVNLRSCTVEPGSCGAQDRGFRVNPRPCEGATALDFRITDLQDCVKSWVVAMSVRTDRKRTLSDPNRTVLPVLEEEEE